MMQTYTYVYVLCNLRICTSPDSLHMLHNLEFACSFLRLESNHGILRMCNAISRLLSNCAERVYTGCYAYMMPTYINMYMYVYTSCPGCLSVGGVFTYLAKLPMLGDACGSRLAYLTSLLEVSRKMHTCDSSPHLPCSHPSAANEAWYWLKCVLCSG